MAHVHYLYVQLSVVLLSLWLHSQSVQMTSKYFLQYLKSKVSSQAMLEDSSSESEEEEQAMLEDSSSESEEEEQTETKVKVKLKDKQSQVSRRWRGEEIF